MAREFHLTGKHVLGALIAFFLVILAANVIFIKFAVKTFPGEKEEKSYLQGLNYNERLAARQEQSALGWTATIDDASLNNGAVVIKLTIADRSGRPLNGLDVRAVLSRPTSATEDVALEFSPAGNGRYAATSPAGRGVWSLEGSATNSANDQVEFVNRLILR